MIYFIGRALYGPRVGFWSAIVFATLPGVSYSSLLITTDVPLMLLWTVMLYAWVMLVKRQSMASPSCSACRSGSVSSPSKR